ncbi:hypothetical protein NDU88_004104 [Pleurodeles waltl]|uniref:Secreted protein n=1 Tax=Pleurodeles waltl TaxID=8319 RepID=A0AAV7V2M5_PLEWA|nr:hypothetical protein NDU88_004104 [Pleurodeles waltl]
MGKILLLVSAWSHLKWTILRLSVPVLEVRLLKCRPSRVRMKCCFCQRDSSRLRNQWCKAGVRSSASLCHFKQLKVAQKIQHVCLRPRGRPTSSTSFCTQDRDCLRYQQGEATSHKNGRGMYGTRCSSHISQNLHHSDLIYFVSRQQQ